MKILVACEESQAVTIELRRLGHEAYSCDIIPCSGGHPEWHIMQNVLPLLNGNCSFKNMDGSEQSIETTWDMIIAHPPCTFLTVAGNKWFKPEYKDRFPYREKPQGIMSSRFRKPDQYIEPYMFGDREKKKTGLWMRGLPRLKPTNIVEPIIIECASGAREPRWHMETMHLPPKERSRLRSKTFPGIAKAMAEQWAGDIR